jgi:hypothetical protein
MGMDMNFPHASKANQPVAGYDVLIASVAMRQARCPTADAMRAATGRQDWLAGRIAYFSATGSDATKCPSGAFHPMFESAVNREGSANNKTDSVELHLPGLQAVQRGTENIVTC